MLNSVANQTLYQRLGDTMDVLVQRYPWAESSSPPRITATAARVPFVAVGEKLYGSNTRSVLCGYGFGILPDGDVF